MTFKLPFSDLLNKFNFALCIVDKEYNIVFANEFFINHYKDQVDDIREQMILDLCSGSAIILKQKIDVALMTGVPTVSTWEENPHAFPFDSVVANTSDSVCMYQNIDVIPVSRVDGQNEYVCLCINDVTTQAIQQISLQKVTAELNTQQKSLNEVLDAMSFTQKQLLQSEKMASIGQLSVGIAHEINNPVGFISSNMQTLDNYFLRINEVLNEFKGIIDASSDPSLIAQKDKLLENSNVDFMLEDVTELISESLDGTSSLIDILKSLKDFSHLDSSEWQTIDICAGIEKTLRIIHNEIKYNIEVILDFDPDTPFICCQPLRLQQVFLNILINASQAIEGHGTIKITVKPKGDETVQIEIEDNGSGIGEKELALIFEPFFTTKPVGSGTGLGLSVSFDIVKGHNGTIEVESQKKIGTRFIVKLPIKQPVG